MDENKKYFFCYSVPLKHFLKEKGLRYDFFGANPNSGLPFWGYPRTEEVLSALTEWGKRYDTET
jgi:hypothetical protein